MSSDSPVSAISVISVCINPGQLAKSGLISSRRLSKTSIGSFMQGSSVGISSRSVPICATERERNPGKSSKGPSPSGVHRTISARSIGKNRLSWKSRLARVEGSYCEQRALITLKMRIEFEQSSGSSRFSKITSRSSYISSQASRRWHNSRYSASTQASSLESTIWVHTLISSSYSMKEKCMGSL